MTHDQDLLAEIPALLAGEDGAADRLAGGLGLPLRQAAAALLGPGSPDLDDVVQESIVAVLGYVRRNGGFEGNLTRFGVTVARNRCRNLLIWRRRRPEVPVDSLADWLARPDRSPLDALLERERLRLLEEALAGLGPDCRTLLRQLYLEGVPAEELRRRSGLRTVQGIHYRKDVCLERAFRILNERLAGCSDARGRGRRRRPPGSGDGDKEGRE